ncbi:MAG: mechanosensitive ion channel family protein [Spirochaetota bacterium]
MDLAGYFQNAGAWLISHGLRIVLIAVIMLIGLRLARFISNKIFSFFKKGKEEEFQKRAETLKSTIRFVLNIGIILVAVMMILGQLGVDIGPILAAAGILGLAVGFGAQSLVKDVISGFFILLEDQIRVGDVVQVSGTGGLVEKINLRMTVLRDLAGNVHYVKNGNIDIVTNMTKDFSRYVFEIGVAYREDVDEVIEVVKEVDRDLRSDPDYKDDITAPIEILGLDQFADSAVIIKAYTTTRPIKQWRVAREFNRRLKKKFDEKNIEIPFPHLTVYPGQDKQDQAPPFSVEVNRDKK